MARNRECDDVREPDSQTIRHLVEQGARPSWSSERRELRFGPVLIKRFTQPADAQEIVLAAFEEEGWPHRIDDPLPQSQGIDPKQRLHKVIGNLNRAHRVPILRFGGGGDGESVCWRLLLPEEESTTKGGGNWDARERGQSEGRARLAVNILLRVSSARVGQARRLPTGVGTTPRWSTP